MKCKNWSNKLNNFVVRNLKSFKINGQQQVLSTMPAMPKEKSSPAALPLPGSNFSELKQLASESSMAVVSSYIDTKVSTEILTGVVTTTPTSTQQQTSTPITNGTSTTNNLIKSSILNKITQQTSNEQLSPAATSMVTTTQQRTSSPGSTRQQQQYLLKKSPIDYVFGKYIGEGSFSTVYLARDIHTNREYAIKVCDKQHIIRERKQEYIRREREVMHMMNNVPGFVNLSCTFQDNRSLYFVMTLAKNGDLLPYINKVGSFDLECTCYYAAELVLAIENMHKRGVVHRDLKPENILLDENMHTLIADFGSAKIINADKSTTSNNCRTKDDENDSYRRRRGSFVGTAQYVSPEVLKGNETSKAADLWALGCIIYQMTSGLPPFRGGSDFLIFKEIMSLNLVFPEGFDKNAEDLVRKLLKLNPEERIGAQDKSGRYESIRTHPFFEGINWDTIRQQTPPPIYPYLPGVHRDEELRSHYRVPDNLEPGLDDRQLTRLLGLELGTEPRIELEKKTETENNFKLTEAEKKRRLEMQKDDNDDKWNQFCDGEIILKKGFVNKRKGLFARKRMLLLTTGPRLIYIDPVQMVKKGEIPWSSALRVEPKSFKIFFVHTPNRTYYLEDPEGYALQWVTEIENIRQKEFGNIAS